MIALLAAPFEPAEALKRFEADAAGAGAIVSFSGHVRSQAASGPVTSLYLQAHSPLSGVHGLCHGQAIGPQVAAVS